MATSWITDGDDPREGPKPIGEKATYADYLRAYRLTLQMKCDDLTPEQLAARNCPPSTLSLLGLVRHLAFVEHFWFQVVAQASSEERLYEKSTDRDADFDGAVATTECVEEAFATWRREVARAEDWLDALPETDLGRALPIAGRDDETVTIRDLLVHMIEEYARHCGHADLLRECIDGRVGE